MVNRSYIVCSSEQPVTFLDSRGERCSRNPKRVKPFLRNQMSQEGWEHVSDPVKSLVRNMLNPESAERASTTECLDMVKHALINADPAFCVDKKKYCVKMAACSHLLLWSLTAASRGATAVSIYIYKCSIKKNIFYSSAAASLRTSLEQT